MHCRCVVFVVVVAMCLSEVFGKTVNNHRSKRTTTGVPSCENVKSFFEMKNISIPLDGAQKGYVCGGKCCNSETESVLKKQGQKDFAAMLQHNSRTQQGLLNSTAGALQNHILELTRQSENKTLILFSQIYGRRAALSVTPINALYLDIRRSIHLNASKGTLSTTSVDLRQSVTRFFSEIFPLVYYKNTDELDFRDFAFDYKNCLRVTVSEIQPFSDIPRQIDQSLTKSLDAMRLFLQALDIGVEVLNTTDTLMMEEDTKSNAECHEALMKMTYCPKCIGIEGKSRPCSGYCLNVLRGCLSKYVAELDSPWNGYVEVIERLVNAMKQHNNEVGVNADAVIKGLDTRISEAIMYAMERSKEIDGRVRRTCGSPKYADKEDPAMAGATTPSPTGAPVKPRLYTMRNNFTPLPEAQLNHFLASIERTKGFYGNLADNLCQDDSFAEPKDQQCWNGDRIGEYTKTVVAAGPSMQRYNPELKLSANFDNGDPRIANLADKLRQVHHLVLLSLGSVGLPVPESLEQFQSDGVDGSGSGSGPGDIETDDDSVRGSGSGGGPPPDEKERTLIDVTEYNPPTNRNGQTPTAAAPTNTQSLMVVFLLALVPTLARYY